MSEPRLIPDRVEFEAWLDGPTEYHLSDEFVGWRSSTRCCPIARFLKHQRGPTSDIVVRINYVQQWIGTETVQEPLPGWAKTFISKIDSPDKPWSIADEASRRVTAAEALEVLRGIQ